MDMCQVYKILHGRDRVINMFERVAEGGRWTRAAADPLNIKVPCSRLEIRKNFFTSRVAEDWNKVPGTIKEARSVDSFKRQYKAYRYTVLAAAR